MKWKYLTLLGWFYSVLSFFTTFVLLMNFLYWDFDHFWSRSWYYIPHYWLISITGTVLFVYLLDKRRQNSITKEEIS